MLLPLRIKDIKLGTYIFTTKYDFIFINENQPLTFIQNPLKNYESMYESKEGTEKYLPLKKKCELLLKESEIRFAGVINYMGNLVAGGFKKGIEPIKDESERKKMFMEAVLRVRTRQEFDKDLGPVSYAASRRKKVVMMTIPISEDHILFISAEPSIEIEKFAKHILAVMKKQE